MSTATAAKVLVLLLIDRVKSDFVLEGSEEAGRPVHLDSPSDYRLPNESYIIVKEKNQPVQKLIRYIAGCPMILVDEQDRAGVKPDPMNDVIWFKNGKLVVADTPEDKGLFDFISRCAWNKDAPDRPSRIKPIFYVEDTAKDAEKLFLERTGRNEAVALVQSLAEVGAKGSKFNEEKIDFLCNLFNVSLAFTYPEKWNVLYDLANQQPEDFINSVASTTNEYRAKINEAVQLDVLSIVGDKASFTGSNKAFYTFLSKEKNTRVDELVSYMLSSGEGHMAYDEVAIQLEAKRKQLASVS